jgi:hypothetical protein
VVFGEPKAIFGEPKAILGEPKAIPGEPKVTLGESKMVYCEIFLALIKPFAVNNFTQFETVAISENFKSTFCS